MHVWATRSVATCRLVAKLPGSSRRVAGRSGARLPVSTHPKKKRAYHHPTAEPRPKTDKVHRRVAIWYSTQNVGTLHPHEEAVSAAFRQHARLVRSPPPQPRNLLLLTASANVSDSCHAKPTPSPSNLSTPRNSLRRLRVQACLQLQNKHNGRSRHGNVCRHVLSIPPTRKISFVDERTDCQGTLDVLF